MKTTLSKSLAGLFGLAGFALVVAGLLGYGRNFVMAGWIVLAFLALALLARLYRHVVQLHLRLDTLFADTGKLAAANRLAAKTGETHSGILRQVLDAQVRQDETLENARQQLQRLEEAERSASRQAADGQHFVLRSFRDLAQKHDQLREQIQQTQETITQRNEKNQLALKRDFDDRASILQREITRSGSEAIQQSEALLQLNRLFDIRGITPALGGWAMEPSSILALLAEIMRSKPDLIVECGSGTSSLWIAYALAANGKGRLVSLDHEQEYAEKTRRALIDHKLDHLVDVRLAPLMPQQVAGETFAWYDPTQVAGLENIDILIVDGPPSATGPLARYPAVPVLASALRDSAVVVVDDAGRRDEKKTMQRWLEEFEGFSKPRLLAARTSVMDFERPEPV